jgi:pimeloyl-ACP methyl ester carboxylesterase
MTVLSHLHYDLYDGDGPPALFVHGIFAGRALWRANIEALRGVCTPVVVELFGHGRSPSPSAPAVYTPAGYLGEFDRIREEVGVERWWLVGHSLGAALTLRYSLDRPERVLGQVFTNSMSGLADEQGEARMAADADQHAERLERAGRDGIRTTRINPAHSRRIASPVREALLADEELLDPAGIANTIRWTTPTASVRSRMAEVRVPTLLIAGQRERAFAPHAEYAARTLPGVTVEALPCGHSPNAERPDEFNQLVVAFMRRLASTSAL